MIHHISPAVTQLTLTLVSDITARKQQRGIRPTHASITEIHALIAQALEALVQSRTLSLHLAGVNRIPAYSLTNQSTPQ